MQLRAASAAVLTAGALVLGLVGPAHASQVAPSGAGCVAPSGVSSAAANAAARRRWVFMRTPWTNEVRAGSAQAAPAQVSRRRCQTRSLSVDRKIGWGGG